MKLYIAHPISGLTGDEVISYFKNLKGVLTEAGFEVLHPMTAKGFFRPEREFKSHGYHGHPQSTNHAVFERDMWMIQQADVVWVDLLGTQAVSIGCMMELAVAAFLHKHTIVLMQPGNVHSHAFAIEAADIIWENLQDALDYAFLLGSQDFGGRPRDKKVGPLLGNFGRVDLPANTPPQSG